MTNEEFVAAVKKNPISFGCGALSLALAAGIYFRGDALPEAEADLTQKSAQVERIALNVQYSAQLKEQLETVTNANKEIDARLVHASRLSSNTQYFYQIENETGVKMIDLRQTTPAVIAKPAKGSYLPVAFSVTVQGTLSQILDFLRHVENGTHYCRVLTASCNGGARNAPLTLALNLELLGVP